MMSKSTKTTKKYNLCCATSSLGRKGLVKKALCCLKGNTADS